MHHIIILMKIYIFICILGDIFGPSFKNLDKLIELPYGCGEQNMAKFAPSVFAAAYMRKTRRFDTNQILMDKIQYTLRTGESFIREIDMVYYLLF